MSLQAPGSAHQVSPGRPGPAAVTKRRAMGRGAPPPGWTCGSHQGDPGKLEAPLGCEPEASTHRAPRLCQARILGAISPTACAHLPDQDMEAEDPARGLPGGG